MPFNIRPNIHYCFAADSVIILDQKADRYLGLAPGLRRAFEAILYGEVISEDDASIRPLMKSGILEWGECLLPRTTPSLRYGPEAAIGYLPRPRYDDVIHAARHLVTAYWRLKRRSFDNLVRFLQTEKRACQSRPLAEDAEIVLRIVSAHKMLGYLFSAHDRCLPHSAALFAHLTSSGVAADMIVGIVPTPFNAHCWVQHGSTVLNDEADHAAMYTPILIL